MDTTLLALQIAAQLLEQLTAINQLVQNAQATGVDVTSDQLDGLVTGYKAAHAQFDADIAAAKAAGK